MGILSHVKELVKELYPHAANYLGRGAVVAAEALQRIGVPSAIAEKALDLALENIPSEKTLVKAGKVAIDMYGEFKRDPRAPAGFIPNAPPFGGIRQQHEYPGYFTRTGYSGLGGGFGRRAAGRDQELEYNDAFPGNPNEQPEVYEQQLKKSSKKKSAPPMKAASKPKKVSSKQKMVDIEPEKTKKKKKKKVMIPSL